MRAQFLTALLDAMNVDPAVARVPGVTVAGHASRAESHRTSGYAVGEHLVVACDPAVEQMLAEATAGMAPTLEAWQQVAIASGGEFLGGARMQLLGGALPSLPSLPDGFTRRSLDRDDSSDLALIARLIETSDADDLDEAEIAIDDLDEIIEVVVDTDGVIAAFASARSFDLAPEYGDIAIMTRSDRRGRGLGSLLVAALCPRLREAGLEPLYSCGEDNTGSLKLSASLGFEIATQLIAYRFPQNL